MGRLDNYENEAKDLLGAERYQIRKHNFKNIRRNALGIILFKDFKEFVEHCCAFALFQENYEFINEFWNYKQPFDASAINAGNEGLLPEHMNDILHKFVNQEGDISKMFKYPLEGNHEINYYYKQYIALLFYRQYTLHEILYISKVYKCKWV